MVNKGGWFNGGTDGLPMTKVSYSLFWGKLSQGDFAPGSPPAF
jgi:hypothetical protein